MRIADPQLEPAVLCRIVEVVHDAYSAGYIQITDHFSFLTTLVARFKVVQGTNILYVNDRELGFCASLRDDYGFESYSCRQRPVFDGV